MRRRRHERVWNESVQPQDLCAVGGILWMDGFRTGVRTPSNAGPASHPTRAAGAAWRISAGAWRRAARSLELRAGCSTPAAERSIAANAPRRIPAEAQGWQTCAAAPAPCPTPSRSAKPGIARFSPATPGGKTATVKGETDAKQSSRRMSTTAELAGTSAPMRTLRQTVRWLLASSMPARPGGAIATAWPATDAKHRSPRRTTAGPAALLAVTGKRARAGSAAAAPAQRATPTSIASGSRATSCRG